MTVGESHDLTIRSHDLATISHDTCVPDIIPSSFLKVSVDLLDQREREKVLEHDESHNLT